MEISNITKLSDCIFFNAKFNGELIELAITTSELETEMVKRYSNSDFMTDVRSNYFGEERFEETEKYNVDSDFAEIFEVELNDKEKAEVLNCVLDNYREFSFETKLDFILESMNDAISFKKSSIKNRNIVNQILNTIDSIIK